MLSEKAGIRGIIANKLISHQIHTGNKMAALYDNSIIRATSEKDIESNKQADLESVKNYYGKVLSKSEDLKTNACCTAATPPDRNP